MTVRIEQQGEGQTWARCTADCNVWHPYHEVEAAEPAGEDPAVTIQRRTAAMEHYESRLMAAEPAGATGLREALTVEVVRIALENSVYSHDHEGAEVMAGDVYDALLAALPAEPAGATGLREAELDALRDGLQRCSERVVALLAAEKKTR